MTRPELTKLRDLVRQSLLARAALVILAVVVALGLAAPHLPLPNPKEQNLSEFLRPPVGFPGGSRVHPLGTDHLGRDILSRVVWGARFSLLVGFTAVLVAMLVGVPIGLTAAYYGGRWEEGVMRGVDIVLAVPQVLVAIAVLAVLGQGVAILVAILGLRTSVWYARTVRSRVLSVREELYVKAARAVGVSNGGIILRHILPNSIAPIIVLSSVYVGLMILVESSLSFLGLTRINISWGWMIAESRDHLATSWWTATFPGLFIFSTVLSVNILGDVLRDAFDPSLVVHVD